MLGLPLSRNLGNGGVTVTTTVSVKLQSLKDVVRK
jgi:hypothetical protein